MSETRSRAPRACRKSCSSRTDVSVKCRALKIKCRGGDDPPCKRCRDQGLSCGFVARSNAGPGSADEFGCSETWRQSVMDRLQALEVAGQSSGGGATATGSDPPSVPAYSHILEDDPLTPYHQALEAVLTELPVASKPLDAWSSAFTRPLWTAYVLERTKLITGSSTVCQTCTSSPDVCLYHLLHLYYL